MQTASKIMDHASEGKNDEHACTNNRKPAKVLHVDFFLAVPVQVRALKQTQSPHNAYGTNLGLFSVD